MQKSPWIEDVDTTFSTGRTKKTSWTKSGNNLVKLSDNSLLVNKIYFLLVRIKIKHMEVAIIKRETTGSGPNTFHDNETIAK